MELDVSLLTTVAECETAIEITQAEKTLLERRLRNLGESLEGKSSKTVEVKEGIVSVQAIITGYQAALEVISDAKEKRNLELKIEREETKLKSLQNRDANYSAVDVIESQLNHQQLDSQIPVLEAAISQLEARKAVLTA
ncbi:conserved protein of unknown function [Tenacibaculum sp. 190524A02b]|uniref:hypothetical protein n=1 Tax=Tenacibaculum vairaonense TaxID=3137860 RepID=UPI0032B16C5C